MSRYLRKDFDAAAREASKFNPPVCDFCGLHAPQFVYASRRTLGGVWVNCWRWAACPDCAAQVEEDNWVPLILQITNMIAPKMRAFLAPKEIRACVDVAVGEFKRYAIKESS